jgi:hypothetical protein
MCEARCGDEPRAAISLSGALPEPISAADSNVTAAAQSGTGT